MGLVCYHAGDPGGLPWAPRLKDDELVTITLRASHARRIKSALIGVVGLLGVNGGSLITSLMSGGSSGEMAAEMSELRTEVRKEIEIRELHRSCYDAGFYFPHGPPMPPASTDGGKP